MTEEQLKACLEAFKADPELQAKLSGAKDPDAIVAIAREDGFAISMENLKRMGLSNEELDAVTGGAMNNQCGCNSAVQSDRFSVC